MSEDGLLLRLTRVMNNSNIDILVDNDGWMDGRMNMYNTISKDCKDENCKDLDLLYIDFIHSGKASSDNDKVEEQKALFSKATGLTGKTAEHGYWLRISDEREVLR
jgi:hypothetical protein